MLFKRQEQLEILELFPGGAERDRTADLLNAIQALSQLSYSPVMFFLTPAMLHLCLFVVKYQIGFCSEHINCPDL